MSYVQAPPLTDKEIDNFLKEPILARICSLNNDGTIHAVPVWFMYEKGVFVIPATEKTQKIKNILRNPNVTLLIDVGGPNFRGVIVYGKGDVDFGEWDAEGISITEKYIKDSSKAQKWWKGFHTLAKQVKITIKVDKIISFDYDKDIDFINATTFN